MSAPRPGHAAVAANGWLRSHKWLFLRRASQLSIIGLFLLGPWVGVWIVKGNLSSSMTLDILPLTDPFVFLQSISAGYIAGTTAVIGVVIVLLFYILVGGRVYCSWVCPVNIVTDAARWLRTRLGIREGASIWRGMRFWLLGGSLVAAVATGTIAWELINPVSMMHRGIIFGFGLGWILILTIFFVDLLLSRNAWCGKLCPQGAFYGLVGAASLVRVNAAGRERCNDCMDCYAVCPEPQVIRPALKGAERGAGPMILDGNCTNCGRCIDVCAPAVFGFGNRITGRKERDATPGSEAGQGAGA